MGVQAAAEAVEEPAEKQDTAAPGEEAPPSQPAQGEAGGGKEAGKAAKEAEEKAATAEEAQEDRKRLEKQREEKKEQAKEQLNGQGGGKGDDMEVEGGESSSFSRSVRFVCGLVRHRPSLLHGAGRAAAVVRAVSGGAGGVGGAALKESFSNPFFVTP